MVSTVSQTLKEAAGKLINSSTPDLDVSILLAHVLHTTRTALYARLEDELSPDDAEKFKQLIQRRGQGEPIAYITGQKEFMGLSFKVNPDVLIPRPETELMVEAAIEEIKARENASVADIGSGSGAIAVSIARLAPEVSKVYATDISPQALQVAEMNARFHQVEDRIDFKCGDLFEPLSEKVDIVIANLPYVAHSESEVMPADVLLYEPHLALFSESEGLEMIGRLLMQVPDYLHDHGSIFLEFGYRQREPLQRLIERYLPRSSAKFYTDYAGWDRFVHIKMP